MLRASVVLTRAIPERFRDESLSAIQIYGYFTSVYYTIFNSNVFYNQYVQIE